MSYSTPQSVRLALNPAGDPNDKTTAASLPDATIQDAIDEADATIDAFIGGRYAVPVAVVAGKVPMPIPAWSRNIAAYNATLTFRRGKDLTATDPVQLRYTATMSALTAVRDGKAVLQIPDNSGTNAATGGVAVSNPYTGDLWTADDFNIGPASTLTPQDGWPTNNVW